MLGDMKVKIVQFDRNIFGPEPEYNPSWSPLTKLRWEAGVSSAYAEFFCGERPRIRVTQFGAWMNHVQVEDYFRVFLDDRTVGTGGYEAARIAIMAAGDSFQALQRRWRSRDEPSPIFDRLVVRHTLQPQAGFGLKLFTEGLR
jgi:hypothetical protein